MVIVEENASQGEQIAAIHRVAFGGASESELVDRLRRDGLIAVSLVACDDSDVVGHILFSDLAVSVDGRAVKAAALAPLAVHPDHQRRGIGSRLVQAGLSLARDRRYEAVVVVGHPDYYPRFGFSSLLARKLVAPFSGDAFMALELTPGSLSGASGAVHYPGAFGLG